MFLRQRGYENVGIICRLLGLHQLVPFPEIIKALLSRNDSFSAVELILQAGEAELNTGSIITNEVYHALTNENINQKDLIEKISINHRWEKKRSEAMGDLSIPKYDGSQWLIIPHPISKELFNLLPEYIKAALDFKEPAI